MKIKWILICLLAIVGITGCKDNKEPVPEPYYYDGLWVANSLGDTTANPDCLLFVEEGEYAYATIDWNELCIYPCEGNAAEQYKNLSFTYCAPLFYDWSKDPSLGLDGAIKWEHLVHFINGAAWAVPLGFLIKGIVDNNRDLYLKAKLLDSLSTVMKKDLDQFDKDLDVMYKQLKNELLTLERTVKKVDSVRAITLRQNRLAYFRKCNDDLVNEQQIVDSRARAYFSTINELLNVSVNNTREDTLIFYRRIDPIVSEWAGEGGIYIEQVKNLTDKMLTTYSVSSLGQSTYDVGMPSVYLNLAKWSFPNKKTEQQNLYYTLCVRDLNKLFFAYMMTSIYCETKMTLYNSIEAEISFKEFVALKEKLLKCYPLKKQS